MSSHQAIQGQVGTFLASSLVIADSRSSFCRFLAQSSKRFLAWTVIMAERLMGIPCGGSAHSDQLMLSKSAALQWHPNAFKHGFCKAFAMSSAQDCGHLTTTARCLHSVEHAYDSCMPAPLRHQSPRWFSRHSASSMLWVLHTKLTQTS